MTGTRSIGRLLVGLALVVSVAGVAIPASARQMDHGTPETTHMMYSCDTPMSATPGSMPMDEHGEETHADEVVEFDLAYIDMMIPHHGSIIALAEVALPTLTDQRLIDMANAIIATQTAEQEVLQSLRDQYYPDAATFDAMDHEALHTAFPSLMTWDVPMDEWGNIMNADWQVETFCASNNPDLAFIEQTIPHHEMAILASEDALTMSVHPEIKTIAEQVIPAQQAEIDLLNTILAELNPATPAS